MMIYWTAMPHGLLHKKTPWLQLSSSRQRAQHCQGLRQQRQPVLGWQAGLPG